jgi:hypothetical protein
LRIHSATRRIPLQLRQLRQGVVLVRASNDTVVDEYGTTITVEAGAVGLAPRLLAAPHRRPTAQLP